MRVSEGDVRRRYLSLFWIRVSNRDGPVGQTAAANLAKRSEVHDQTAKGGNAQSIGERFETLKLPRLGALSIVRMKQRKVVAFPGQSRGHRRVHTSREADDGERARRKSGHHGQVNISYKGAVAGTLTGRAKLSRSNRCLAQLK